ncbi:hypothetical protein C8F01DRAFT_1255474 [Mycena amicta]|nr:hypothetical protein C8F01DRAFT_1255474 [Mycena amicta]
MSSESEPKTILVMLSTGKQGGGVVRALAKANAEAVSASRPQPWYILAQTRTPSTHPKSIFTLPGVHALKGSPTNPSALFDTANLPPDTPLPIYAVFSVQQSVDNPRGLPGEIDESRTLADAAAKHGVKHFVYSSVQFGGADGRRTKVPHFETKRQIEEYLESTHPTLPTTVLRPVTFMDQLVSAELAHARDKSKPKADWRTRVTRLIFLTQLKPTTKLQLIAAKRHWRRCSDDGHFKDVDLAGDELSTADMEAVWRDVFASNAKGYDKQFRPPNTLLLPLLARVVGKGMKELRLMFAFFNQTGFTTDIPALRAAYPGLKDLRAFLKEEVLGVE